MTESLCLVWVGLGTLLGSAAIDYVADKFRQPARGTRLPLGQIQQNIQPEKKSTFLKSTQRPLSVPNLKSLFNATTKLVNDENKDVEKFALSEYLPTTYVAPARKGLGKRNTTIFRDPILKTVQEVEDGSVAPSAVPVHNHAASRDTSAPQPENMRVLPASSYPCDSIIESTKDITLAQQDAKKDDIIAVVASEPQITNTRNFTSINKGPPALSLVSEPEVHESLDIANAAEQYLNPPALPNNSEPSFQDSQTVTNGPNTKVDLSALTTTSEPAVHKDSSSPELNESLIIKKVRGPTSQESNPALSNPVDTRQVTTIHHAVSEQSGTKIFSQEAIPMVSEDRIVTTFLRDIPQPSITVNEAVVTVLTHEAPCEDKSVHDILGSAIPTASNGRKVSALYTSVQATAPSAIKGLDVPTHEDAQSLPAAMSKATSDKIRTSSLDRGPPLPDPNGPTGLRAAVAKSIQANVLKSNLPIEAPKKEEKLSGKKRRDATLRAAEHLAPMPWAPALQPPNSYQHADSCAAVGMLGPKAVQSRYLTPHYALPQELHGVDPSKEEDAYDSYDEEDDYVTAQSSRSTGETTIDGATTDLFPRWNQKARREIAEATVLVESTRTQEDLEDEAMDPTMVAEYADEIFAHLRHLEVKMLPNPFYMEEQNELQWSMRSVLMDWLVQVHSRCNLLPETLFITANFVDRFLSGKIVSLGKLQLVGATALFLAAKKEEINCPTLSEIVYMVDNTYTSDELIKAERYMLNILQWELEFPGPMSFLRRISKADDYDLETRTLAKYFLEVTLMEERFIGTPCSFAAAGSHCLARLLLKKGSWTPYHVYYSNYTYSQLHPLLRMLLYCVENPMRHHAAVYEKYADKRFKRASTYVEVELQRGFILPHPPTSLNRNIVDNPVAPYTMTTYNNPFNYHVASAPSSGRVFST